MATGRCAGCGRTDSLRKVGLHIVECEAYIKVFLHHPERALDPAAEYERHRTENTPEVRAEARGHRLHARFAEIARQQAASASRWARPPDILE